MKKTLMIISLSAALLLSGLSFVSAQEQPKPQKDTVNMDTQAKPTNYYAIEDEKTAPEKGKTKSSSFPIIIIVGAVVIVGAAAFFFLKKRKK
jgi:LPXTG-motif cell wall-anchored protein